MKEMREWLFNITMLEPSEMFLSITVSIMYTAVTAAVLVSVCVYMCECGLGWEWGKSNWLDVCTAIWNCLLSVCVCVWLSNFPPSHFLLCFHISNPLLNTRSILSVFLPQLSNSIFSVCVRVYLCVFGVLVFYEVGSLLFSRWIKLVVTEKTKQNSKWLTDWFFWLGLWHSWLSRDPF